MRTPLIAGNWKMFKTVRESVAFVTDLRARVAGLTAVDIVVAPTFPALHAVAKALEGSSIGVAAQNLHWEREGAFTALGVGSVAILIGQGLLYAPVLASSQDASIFPGWVTRAIVALSLVQVVPLVTAAIVATRRLLPPEEDEPSDVAAQQTTA